MLINIEGAAIMKINVFFPYLISCIIWLVLATILKNQETIISQLNEGPTTTSAITSAANTDSAQYLVANYAPELLRRSAAIVDDSLGKSKVIIKSISEIPDEKNTFSVKCDFVSGSRIVSATSKLQFKNDGLSMDDWTADAPDFA